MKRLLLMRHGTPVSEEENPDRPLSVEGTAEAEAAACGIVQYLGTPTTNVRILHSGKVRARQTAETLKRALADAFWACSCDATDSLNPKDDPDIAVDIVSADKSSVLILVGHLPHMGLLASKLIGAPAAAGRLAGSFHPAGGLVLRDTNAAWVEEIPEAQQPFVRSAPTRLAAIKACTTQHLFRRCQARDLSALLSGGSRR